MWKLALYGQGGWKRKKKCRLCGKESITISGELGVCADCLRERPREALRIAARAHEKRRAMFGLPPEPPRDPRGISCKVCDLECRISPGGKGFCGLVMNEGGRLKRLAGTPDRGVVDWYYDPIPTNCVAAWFCPASTGTGYPKYARSPGPEYGFYNLAVFYGACSLDCVFCQNWHYRQMAARISPVMRADELAAKAGAQVSCICFFGGDAVPQAPHALFVAKRAVARAGKRPLRICWETSGHFSPQVMKEVVKISLETGGIIKFDLKAWTPAIYRALTGVDIGRVYENAAYVLREASKRPEVPLFTASTLLVPGYVDEYEVRRISSFIASFDRNTPYTLLAFHPSYLMYDLPPTSTRHAKEALKAAREEGLRNVRLGNRWLLGPYY